MEARVELVREVGLSREVELSRDKQLDEWLFEHYYPGTRTLDLAIDQFFFLVSNWWGIYEVRDYSYRVHLPQFMKDPNSFLSDNPQIKRLNLSGMAGNWPTGRGLDELSKNTTLKALDLSENGLYPSDAITISKNLTLKTVDLGYNHVSNGVGSFAHNRVVEALYVPANQIGPTGAAGIALMPSLRLLDISNNPIGDQAAAAIIRQCTTLRGINLENTGAGKETVKAILENKNLTDIRVSCSEVGCANAWRIWRTESHNADAEKSKFKSSLSFFGKKPKNQPELEAAPQQKQKQKQQQQQADTDKVKPGKFCCG